MMFDRQEGWPSFPAFFRLYVENSSDILRKAIEAGASVITNITALVFGDQVGRIKDPFGNIWWIQERINEVSYEEMMQRFNDPEEVKAMKYVQDTLDQELRNYHYV